MVASCYADNRDFSDFWELAEPAARAPRALPQLLQKGLTAHSVFAFTLTMFVLGAGMVAAVGAATCTVVVPLAVLFGIL